MNLYKSLNFQQLCFRKFYDKRDFFLRFILTNGIENKIPFLLFIFVIACKSVFIIKKKSGIFIIINIVLSATNTACTCEYKK